MSGPNRTGEARKPPHHKGFRAFLLSGLVRVGSLQAVRRWGIFWGIRPDRPQKIFDRGGLYLEISPTESHWWRLKYRFEGKEKLLAQGVYRDVPLALARQRRDGAQLLLAREVDPDEHKNAETVARAEPEANTFEVVALDWLAKRDWTKYRIRVEAWFNHGALPWLGSRPAVELEATDFLYVIHPRLLAGDQAAAVRAEGVGSDQHLAGSAAAGGGQRPEPGLLAACGSGCRCVEHRDSPE